MLSFTFAQLKYILDWSGTTLAIHFNQHQKRTKSSNQFPLVGKANEIREAAETEDNDKNRKWINNIDVLSILIIRTAFLTWQMLNSLKVGKLVFVSVIQCVHLSASWNGEQVIQCECKCSCVLFHIRLPRRTYITTGCSEFKCIVSVLMERIHFYQ